MEELTLTTPTFLFSAVSLVLLAHTNRFLAYAQLVRNLTDSYMEDKSVVTIAQIENLRQRLWLIKLMQLIGISSLLLCVLTMFLIYIGFGAIAKIIFAVALLALIISLSLSVWEVQISTRSLNIYYLSKMKDKAGEKH